MLLLFHHELAGVLPFLDYGQSDGPDNTSLNNIVALLLSTATATAATSRSAVGGSVDKHDDAHAALHDVHTAETSGADATIAAEVISRLQAAIVDRHADKTCLRPGLKIMPRLGRVILFWSVVLLVLLVLQLLHYDLNKTWHEDHVPAWT
jgi:Flp pilus assembly protein TadB